MGLLTQRVLFNEIDAKNFLIVGCKNPTNKMAKIEGLNIMSKLLHCSVNSYFSQVS
jgi:hypothetical protein